MSTVSTVRPGGGALAPTGSRPDVVGRIEVRERVVRKVSERIASEVIGVAPGDVSATAVDYRDGVAVRVRTPMPVPSLDDTAAVQAAGAVVDLAQRMQRELRDRLAAILGRPITRVDITITGATTHERRRVR